MPMNRKDYHPAWDYISQMILRRADGKCELCKARAGVENPVTGSIVILTVHHIDGDKRNDSPLNLLGLCQRCHLRLDAPYREKRRRLPTRDLFDTRGPDGGQP